MEVLKRRLVPPEHERLLRLEAALDSLGVLPILLRQGVCNDLPVLLPKRPIALDELPRGRWR
jgi:hypothetical protein